MQEQIEAVQRMQEFIAAHLSENITCRLGKSRSIFALVRKKNIYCAYGLNAVEIYSAVAA